MDEQLYWRVYLYNVFNSYYEHKEDQGKIIQAASQQNYLWWSVLFSAACDLFVADDEIICCNIICWSCIFCDITIDIISG